MAEPGIFGIPISAVLIAGAAVVSAVFIYRSARIARKTFKHARMSKLREEYRSDAMGDALIRIGSFKKETAEQAVAAYKGSSDPLRKRYLRNVSQFYNELADLYADWVLRPKRFIFNVWPERDLDIIPKAVIPIVNWIRETEGREKLPKNDNLWKLYRAAERWSKDC